MGVGVEALMQPAAGRAPSFSTPGERQNIIEMTSAASTHSLPGCAIRNGGSPVNGDANLTPSSALDTSKDSITVDVESTHEDKYSAADKLRTPLNNGVNNHGVKIEETAVDWSEFFLDLPLVHYVLAVKKYVLLPLNRHPRSLAFRKPVDSVALGIYPSYNQIITRPMDLGTVKSKIEKNLYGNKSGVLNDIDLVWNNAKKFNPNGHEVYESAVILQQYTRDCLSVMKNCGGDPNSSALMAEAKSSTVWSHPTPVRQGGMREARKKAPAVLPGEYDAAKPQHLEQKYVLKLSEPLKACDVILRNLLMQSQHREYVEPFMKADKGGSMCLGLIHERLRNHYYTSSKEFASDMRRIVTETYRAADNPEEDFRSLKVAKLQGEFERQYALVNTDNEGSLQDVCSAFAKTDPYIGKLIAAQKLINNIQTDVSSLVDDYEEWRMEIKTRKERVREMACKSRKSLPPSKRKQNGNTPKKSPSKRVKTDAKTVRESVANSFSKKPSPEQIGQWIGMLDDTRQESLLELLRRHGENIEVDEDGSVELSLENWSQKTLDDVELFLHREILTGQSKSMADDNKLAPRKEDSSSGSDSSSSDSSSLDSSDEE